MTSFQNEKCVWVISLFTKSVVDLHSQIFYIENTAKTLSFYKQYEYLGIMGKVP